MRTQLSHYPRPWMRREQWLNLNGLWDFQLNHSKTLLDLFDSTICVPYCVESEASGITLSVLPDHVMHYRRMFNIKRGEKQSVLLHFGAVDQDIDVYVNRQWVAHHQGGYASFYIDISEYLIEGENELYGVVCDGSETTQLARGKQRLYNKGSMRHIFYTPTSGIWQTVWIEVVPQDAVMDIDYQTDIDLGRVGIEVKTKEGLLCHLRISFDDQVMLEQEVFTNQRIVCELSQLYLWSPEHPHLYQVEIIYKEDRVQSYFAMRMISVIEDRCGIKRFALNNIPYFMNGVLDQGYWPSSLLTPPHDEALERDIKSMKEAGFNTLRKHVKVEVEHFYYLCDTLGMLVWQDMPNGGKDYNFNFVTYLPNVSDFLSRHIRDHHYAWFGRKDKAKREIYYQELGQMVKQLRHYPSVVVWVPFNEGWGQFDAQQASELIQSLDSTRLINEACGWFDQGGGDIYTYHSYFKSLKIKPKNRVIALSEYGGQALVIKDHTQKGETFGYKMLDRATANEALRMLVEQKVMANIKEGLSAAIYTQLSDVETEVNGLMTFDREVFKFDLALVKLLNHRIYELFATQTKSR